MTDFPSLIRLLSNQKIEFIIVGGAAAIAHGSSRLTQDLDIVYRRTPDNMKRLAECLAPYSPYLRGAPPGLPFRFDVETIKGGMNFTLTTSLGAIDLLGEITSGGNYDELTPYTIQLTLFGVTCSCLALRRLIEVKRAAGRPKDFEVIAELESLIEEKEKS